MKKFKNKTFNVWYKTEYGLAVREEKAKNKIELKQKLPLKVKLSLIQIEENKWKK